MKKIILIILTLTFLSSCNGDKVKAPYTIEHSFSNDSIYVFEMEEQYFLGNAAFYIPINNNIKDQYSGNEFPIQVMNMCQESIIYRFTVGGVQYVGNSYHFQPVSNLKQ